MNSKLEERIIEISAAWAAYTPAFALLELSSGYGFDEMLCNRFVGLGTFAFVGPALQYTKRKLAERLEVYEDERFRKFLIGEAAVLTIQPIVYAGILGTTALAYGQSFSEYTEHLANTILPALGIALAATPFFGKFVEFWEKHVFNSTPTFRRRETVDFDGLDYFENERNLHVISRGEMQPDYIIETKPVNYSDLEQAWFSYVSNPGREAQPAQEDGLSISSGKRGDLSPFR